MTDWAKEKALEMTGPCTCLEGFKSRGLIDPHCRFHDDAGATEAALNKAKADGLRAACTYFRLSWSESAVLDKAAFVEGGGT